MRRLLILGGMLCALFAAGGPPAARAGSGPDVVIHADHMAPSTLSIPAGKRVKLEVANRSGRPAEFEGRDFTVEKVIPAGITLPVYVGPLKSGTYHFFNDFAPATTGRLQVK